MIQTRSGKVIEWPGWVTNHMVKIFVMANRFDSQWLPCGGERGLAPTGTAWEKNIQTMQFWSISLSANFYSTIINTFEG